MRIAWMTFLTTRRFLSALFARFLTRRFLTGWTRRIIATVPRNALSVFVGEDLGLSQQGKNNGFLPKGKNGFRLLFGQRRP